MTDLAEFRALGISETFLEALRLKGFEEPTPIQEQTIPLLLSGERDLIGQAQTGTGKTAAFGLPILETLPGGARDPGALILSPTRELCLQTAQELNSLKGTRELKVLPLYGGQAIEIQLRGLHAGLDIAVGTPGRIQDLIDRGALNLGALRFAVLDEADEMLNMGFIEEIESILAHTPREKRMLMFSATMPEPILKIAEKFMRPGYGIVRTEPERLAVDLTDQIYYEVRREDRLEALSRLIDMEDRLFAMVFCRTRNDVDDLTENLNARGYAVEALHGDIAQAQRTRVINRFKAQKFRILIATDVAARGIDVSGLTHVINYSIPLSTEAYVHRIGRTGRAGKRGTALTFVSPSELRQLSRIRREANVEIRKGTLPSPSEVVCARRRRAAEKIAAVIAGEEGLQEYLPVAESLLAAGSAGENAGSAGENAGSAGENAGSAAIGGECSANPESGAAAVAPGLVLAALLRLHYGDSLLEKGCAPLSSEKKRGRPRFGEERERGGKKEDAGRFRCAGGQAVSPGKDREMDDETRFYFGAGRASGYGPAEILEFLFRRAGLRKNRIGKIDVHDDFSFFSVDSSDAVRLEECFRRHGRHDEGPRVRMLYEEDEKRGKKKRFSSIPASGRHALIKGSFRGGRRSVLSSPAEDMEDPEQPAPPPYASPDCGKERGGQETGEKERFRGPRLGKPFYSVSRKRIARKFRDGENSGINDLPLPAGSTSDSKKKARKGKNRDLFPPESKRG